MNQIKPSAQRNFPDVYPSTSDKLSSFELASQYKIGQHTSRIQDYIRGKDIFPVSLELDITSECTLRCPECPSVAADMHHSLDMRFIDRLFATLEGHTGGLLLTGGEPTMAAQFSETLKQARKRKFKEIAVVTNGTRLHNTVVIDALLEYATTIRLSMYDWEGDSCGGMKPILKRIESLRKKIDGSQSPLLIGVSVLTSTGRISKLDEMVQSISDAGAHWIYFHPLCKNWGLGCPKLENQRGVFQKITEIQQTKGKDIGIFTLPVRYDSSDIIFSRYHAAHFLLVIGADGRNYLGPEVKYQKQFAIADLSSKWDDRFLWKEGRLRLVNAVNSRTYPAVRSRHRGVLYNHVVESMLTNGRKVWGDVSKSLEKTFLFPYIL